MCRDFVLVGFCLPAASETFGRLAFHTFESIGAGVLPTQTMYHTNYTRANVSGLHLCGRRRMPALYVGARMPVVRPVVPEDFAREGIKTLQLVGMMEEGV